MGERQFGMSGYRGSRRKKSLLPFASIAKKKKPVREGGVRPAVSQEPGKISEMILDFAAPLLDVAPGGPANIEGLRAAMKIAMVCWNLPAYQDAKHPLGVEGQRFRREGGEG